MYLSLSVSGCLCLCICLFVSLCLGQCHHQMISFHKIYGLYGLEHHTVEKNGDVTLGDGHTDGHTCECRARILLGVNRIRKNMTSPYIKWSPIQLFPQFRNQALSTPFYDKAMNAIAQCTLPTSLTLQDTIKAIDIHL